MELFKTLRRKCEASKQRNARQHAEEFITIDDFDGKLYIAVEGIPAILFEDSTTMAEMMERLETLRNDYVNYRMKCHQRNRTL